DRYDPRGSTSIGWTRTIREQNASFYLTGISDPHANDVQNAITFARSRWFESGELTAGVTLVREFNRDLQNDSWNTNVLLGYRFEIARRHRPKQ
ncbi:MAG TPA: hypothetical protein VIM21_01515, partial [Gemmatimonadaceae bacterium]